MAVGGPPAGAAPPHHPTPITTSISTSTISVSSASVNLNFQRAGKCTRKTRRIGSSLAFGPTPPDYTFPNMYLLYFDSFGKLNIQTINILIIQQFSLLFNLYFHIKFLCDKCKEQILQFYLKGVLTIFK